MYYGLWMVTRSAWEARSFPVGTRKEKRFARRDPGGRFLVLPGLTDTLPLLHISGWKTSYGGIVHFLWAIAPPNTAGAHAAPETIPTGQHASDLRRPNDYSFSESRSSRAYPGEHAARRACRDTPVRPGGLVLDLHEAHH